MDNKQNTKKRTDGCYTPVLIMVPNVSCNKRRTNQELFLDLPKLTEMLRERRLRLAGHCIRHEEEIAQKLVICRNQREDNGAQEEELLPISALGHRVSPIFRELREFRKFRSIHYAYVYC